MFIRKLLISLKQNWIYLLFVFFAAGIILIDTCGYNLKLYYSDGADENGHLRERLITYNNQILLSDEYSYPINSKSGANCIKSSQWTRKGNLLNLEFSWDDEKNATREIKIKKIEFRFLFFSVMGIDPTNYMDYIKSDQKIYKSENEEICIVPEDNVAAIVINSNDLMSLGGIQNRIKSIKTGIVGLLLFLGIIFLLLDFFISSVDRSLHIKWSIILCFICCLVFYTGINGSKNASPDEDVSTGAVKYYYTHWGFPDLASEDAVMSYSDYGFSRLTELTPYYFIAGKTGALFENLTGMNNAARMLNALLFALMCIFYIVEGKRNKWLLVGLVFTPQLWYVFSYTTSDAWDLFLCFLLVSSIVYKNRNRTKASFAVYQGVLMGLILLGKACFYVAVLFSGLYMLFKVGCQKNKKKGLLYLSISILVAVVIYISRKTLDQYVYQGLKYRISSVEGEKYRTINPIPLQKQGFDLYYVLKNTTFVDFLLKSFAGTYGWMEIFSSDIYYFCIGSLYGLFFIYIVRHIGKMKHNNPKIELFISIGMIPLMFVIVLLQSWKADFQPQGRYLLATVPCLLPVLSRSKRLLSSCGFEFILEGMALAGIMSFVFCQMAVIC